MPQDTKQQQQKSTAAVQPTRGFLSRMFGDDEMTPEMLQGIEIARKENPNLAPIESYGPLSRMVQPKAMGYVSPNNKIYLNPAQKGQSAQDWADTLTHEQEHVNQSRSRGYGPTMQLLRSMFMPENLPYGQRPDEMSAFQAERARRSNMGREQSPVPSFTNPGQYYIPRDINLPVDKPKTSLPEPKRVGPVTMR